MLPYSIVVVFCILSHTTGWNFGSICQYHLSALIVITIYDPISKVQFAGQLLVMQSYLVCPRSKSGCLLVVLLCSQLVVVLKKFDQCVRWFIAFVGQPQLLPLHVRFDITSVILYLWLGIV